MKKNNNYDVFTLKKVTVTGFVTEEFVGNPEQVHQYLLDLKKKQEDEVGREELKKYRKEMPVFKLTHLHFEGYTNKYNTHANWYRVPNYFLTEFRKKHESKGLKIRIEPFDN